MRTNQRSLRLWLGVLIAFALVAAACGDDDGTATTAQTTATTAATTTTAATATTAGSTTSQATTTSQAPATTTPPVVGATPDPNAILVYGANQVESLDPIRVSSSCETTVLYTIFDTLVLRDVGGNPVVPGLAESWEVTEDRFRLHLRPGVVFQDGTPFNADAVKFNLDRVKNDEASTIASDLYQVASVEVVDDLTVDLVLDPVLPGALPAVLSGRAGMMASPTAVQAAGTSEAFSAAPVGAGMYKAEPGWTPRESASVRAWDGYWDSNAQGLGGIDFVQIETSARLNALQAGDLDMVQMQPTDVEAIQSDPNLYVKVGSTPALTMFIINETLPPFDNELVRRALFHAIDRRAINDVMNLGLAEVAWGWYPEGHFAYDPALVDYYPYDPALARDLLTQAGYPDGVDFEAVIGSTATNYIRWGELVQDQIAEAGFNMTLTLVDPADTVPSVYRAGPNGTGTAAASPLGFFETADPDILFRMRFLADGSFNPGGNEVDGMRAILDAAVATTDVNERGDLYRQAQELITDLAIDAVPIWFTPGVTAYQDYVGGIQRGRTQCPDDFRGVFITQDKVALEDS